MKRKRQRERKGGDLTEVMMTRGETRRWKTSRIQEQQSQVQVMLRRYIEGLAESEGEEHELPVVAV